MGNGWPGQRTGNTTCIYSRSRRIRVGRRAARKVFELEAHAFDRPSPQRKALGTLRARAPALLPQYRRPKETRAAPSWQRLHSAGAPSEDDEVIHGKIKSHRSVPAIPERSRGCPTGVCVTRAHFYRRENEISFSCRRLATGFLRLCPGNAQSRRVEVRDAFVLASSLLAARSCGSERCDRVRCKCI
jgi:hypothetical protein